MNPENEERELDPRKITPYDREFTQLNHEMFLRFGSGFERSGYDEFHRNYRTLDVRRDEETKRQKTTALNKHGEMKQRTKDSLALLEEHGIDNMDWSAWGKVMREDSKKRLEDPVGERKRGANDRFQQLIVTDEDPRYKEYMEARYGKANYGDNLLAPPPRKTFDHPQQVEWSSMKDRLQDLSPLYFIKDDTSIAWPQELELELAPLLKKTRKSYELWSRVFKSVSLTEFTIDKQLGESHTLYCWSSRTVQRLFVVFLIRNSDNRLENYFYVPVEAAPAPKAPETKE